jgi:hypothetical protein
VKNVHLFEKEFKRVKRVINQPLKNKSANCEDYFHCRIFLLISSTAAIKVAYDNDFFRVQKAQAFSLFSSSSSSSSSDIDLSDVMAQTVTDEEEIKKHKDLMRYRMEAFITNLQGKIVKELQTVEKDATFYVDRWTRKEVFNHQNLICKLDFSYLV